MNNFPNSVFLGEKGKGRGIIPIEGKGKGKGRGKKLSQSLFDAFRMLELLVSEKMNLFELKDVEQLIRQMDLDGGLNTWAGDESVSPTKGKGRGRPWFKYLALLMKM